jgi:hypothetical protein
MSSHLQVLWHWCAALFQCFYQVWRVSLLIRPNERDGSALVARTTSAPHPAAVARIRIYFFRLMLLIRALVAGTCTAASSCSACSNVLVKLLPCRRASTLNSGSCSAFVMLLSEPLYPCAPPTPCYAYAVAGATLIPCQAYCWQQRCL